MLDTGNSQIFAVFSSLTINLSSNKYKGNERSVVQLSELFVLAVSI